jgi:hypothetical protein
VLSASEKFPVSIWELGGYLAENCAEARGEGSDAFVTMTVAKALDQMKQTEMIERKANGIRLTENGRWSLLRKGDGETLPRTMEQQLPAGTLLARNKAKMSALGVDLKGAQLLMEVHKLEWSMKEFLEKAGKFAPTLLLIEMKNGTECGGVAGVPWPKIDEGTADLAKASFIFSLGPNPTRFNLIRCDWALHCCKCAIKFGGGGSNDLYLCGNGAGCGALGRGAYAGPLGPGQLIGGTGLASQQPYERWELWRL